jgi:hypothetical protein
VDPHARQYSLITQSLLKTTTAHFRKRELHLRSQQKQASAQLFGLLPSDPELPIDPSITSRPESAVPEPASTVPQQNDISAATLSDWTIYDADFLTLPWSNENDQGLQDFLQPGTHTMDGVSVADIPLFPMYDQQMGGGFF